MKLALEKLKKQVCSLHPPQILPDEKWENIKDKFQVALMTGGESSRFQEVPGAKGANKNSLKLPNGDTMLEMTIRMYRAAGIKDFLALVYHQADSIIDLLGDGSSLGVNISYSHDPEKPVGKGGAIRHALKKGLIREDKHLIVHNPDDVILDFKDKFVRHIISGHLEGVQKGKIATVVVVEETPYAYTGMKIVDNNITQIEMYPLVPLPTHIGVTVFSPTCFSYFRRLFSLEKKSDFEKVLFPALAEENKLYAVSIPSSDWLAVNNLKAYKQLLAYLENDAS